MPANRRNGLAVVALITAGLGMAIVAAIGLAAQNSGLELAASQAEYAMSPGTKITATTSLGTISITAVDRRTRSYMWEGAVRTFELVPRAERWNGSLGIYADTGGAWQEHNGVNRGVLEEGQQHFDTVEDALNFIKKRSWVPSVYRDDGLMVLWGKDLSRKQLNAEVWQILVNGEKPTALPGSNNDQIVLTSTEKNAPTPSPDNSDQKKPCGAKAIPQARNEIPADRRSALEMRLKEFNERAAPGVADSSAAEQLDPSCDEIKSMLRQGQDLFASGAKITVEAPKSIAWPRNGGKDVERVSPEEFVRTSWRIAFTALLQQIVAGDPVYEVDKDQATVHQKQFLVDMTGVTKWDFNSVVVDYDMAWVFKKQWQIKELKQTIRVPTETEKAAIDQALKAAKGASR